MPRRIPRRAKFLIERLIVRGPLYRLLVVAGIVAFVSLAGGLFVHWAGEFQTVGEAVWWAFLRLTDPGYLGDDEGALLRTVSTIITVMGYVLFLGALIAIMIQWFNARMRHLEQGLTPIAQKNHLLVLGWTNRTPAILRELLASQARVRRFLRRRGAGRRIHVVVLAEDVDAELMQDLRDRLGALWHGSRITLRTGTPLRLEHLRRVDFRNAAAILLPAADFGEGGADTADTRAIKVLLSITDSQADENDEDFPFVVGEVFDARRVDVAYDAYRGPLEIVSSDQMVARLITQTVRHPGLSYVHREILSYGEGNELYVREVEGFEGAYVADLAPGFPQAVVLGLVRPERAGYRALLDPSQEPKVRAGDRLVLLAPDWEATEPRSDFQPEIDEEALRPAPRAEVKAQRRLLVLGWSHRVPALLEELESYENERFDVVVASMVSVAEREESLAHHDLAGERVKVEQRRLDYTVPNDIEKLDLGSWDNVVIVASDWLPTGEESDARSILGHLLVRQMTRKPRPRLLIELTDEENVRLFRGKGTEVFVSPMLLSHMLAQVALRRELRVVFDELFGSGGAEIFFRPVGDFGLEGREVGFLDVQEAVAERGEVALGLRIFADRRRRGGVTLNPSREERFTLGEGDEVVVLTAY